MVLSLHSVLFLVFSFGSLPVENDDKKRPCLSVGPSPVSTTNQQPKQHTFSTKAYHRPPSTEATTPSITKIKMSTKQNNSVLLAPSTYDWSKYNTMYYIKGAAAGGICCSITHGALTPVDVVKTRVQLDPVKYNSGLIGGFRQIIAEEGAMALTTGLGATAAGYFVQGWFKFGGVEFFKINAAKALGEEKAWEKKTQIYIGAAAGAEFIADVFLCPLEAVRIRSVSDPGFCDGLLDGFGKMWAQEGIGGFYAGFLPILAKQIPYTCAKFVVQGTAADAIYGSMGKSPSELSGTTNVGISLLSGVVAGVASAVISHPADTLLSKVNKKGAGGDGPMMSRLANIAREIGFVKLCTVGLIPRCVMIGTLTAGQFGIFDTVMGALGASKFHFHNPSESH